LQYNLNSKYSFGRLLHANNDAVEICTRCASCQIDSITVHTLLKWHPRISKHDFIRFPIVTAKKEIKIAKERSLDQVEEVSTL
jgi:hypothetical protein